MPSSWVDIANSALIKVGAPTIISLEPPDPGVKAATICNLRMYPARDVVLRSHLWNCATIQVVLSPLANVPAFTYGNAFQLPADYLRIAWIDPQIAYKIQGRKILSDETSIELEYIYQVTDPNELEATCADCIASWLAYDICQSLVPNNPDKQGLLKNYQDALRVAKCLDAQEDGPQQADPSFYEEMRQF